MYGYIRPLESELKVREQAAYRAYYCGLCKTLSRRYGQVERLALNYECAFLAAFLTALTGGASFETESCLPRFYRGKRPVALASDALDYAADVNVLLSWHKLDDDVRDNGSVKARAARAALKRAYRRAADRHGALETALEESMTRLAHAEQARSSSTDEPSEAFGRFLSAVILHAPMLIPSERAACEWMFFNVGKWVYLIDAWDDRERDGKTGGYNPFLESGMDADRARFLMNVTLTEAEKAYDLISLAAPDGLIDNVLRLGLRDVTRRVMEQTGSDKSNKGETR